MEKRKIIVEIARVCGDDNAVLTAEIDTSEDTLEYRLKTYSRRLGANDLRYRTYKFAEIAFERFAVEANGKGS